MGYVKIVYLISLEARFKPAKFPTKLTVCFYVQKGKYPRYIVVGQLRPSIVRKMLKLWDFTLSLVKA